MQHINKAKNSKESLDKKIDDLLDDPLDKRILIDVLATVISMNITTAEELKKIPHLKSVDKILKDHLKRDTLPSE
jgi:hypothetical protein